MKLKKILACAMAGAMVLGSLSVVSAETVVGHADTWWTTTNTSTAVSIADGETVTWEVSVVANDGQTDGTYAAFCVEATDGTSYCTATSSGDIWGAGTAMVSDNKDTVWAVFGGTYTVALTRSGNDFTCAIIDDSTEDTIHTMKLEGTSDFGDTTCYIMSQIGDLEVGQVVEATDNVIGHADTWWTTTNTSTALSIEDGETVTFDVTVVANDGQTNGTYAAFCVEATDGTSYCTATSSGDIWGAGTATVSDNKDTVWAVFGRSYTVSISRSGNNFTCTVADGSGETVHTMYLEGTSEFGDTTCYIMSQIGDLEVTYTYVDYSSDNSSDNDDDNTSDDDTSDTDETSDTSDTDDTSDTSDSGDSDSDDEVSYTTVVQTIELEDLEATEWWAVFSDALELVDGQQIVITGTTTNNGEYNWDNALFILYSSDDAAVYASDDEAGTEVNYTEYFVGRLDNYGWGTATYEVTSEPEDWDAWLAATQAGAEFTVTVTYVDGVIQITSACEGAEYVATYTVEDTSTTYYVALTGEACTLTDLVATYYEADEDSIVNTSSSDGDDDDDDDSNTSDDDDDSNTSDDDDSSSDNDNSTTSTNDSKTTSDASAAAPVVIALLGCAVVAFASKKKLA